MVRLTHHIGSARGRERRGAVVTVAVMDVDTTGLSPRTDRVVEVGLVLLDVFWEALSVAGSRA
jgi:hypothetical protein